MKECYWCKKTCPDEEEGDFEVSPEDENIEIGWICDHCVLRFDGKCDCEECKETEKKCQCEYNRKNMSFVARMLSYILS